MNRTSAMIFLSRRDQGFSQIRTALLLTLLLVACGKENTAPSIQDTSDSTDLSIAEDTHSLSSSCASIPLLERPSDPAERGPWPVGVQTVKLGRLEVEVLYPAVLGSEENVDPMEVDIRYALPESEREKVGDDVRPVQVCDCYSDLPLDQSMGPYPLILFVHGTASWRTQSLSLMAHWASRGFIVASADHPGLWLSDLIGGFCGSPSSGNQDLSGDLKTVLTAFQNEDESLNFLAGRVDLERVAVVGHSAGASAATGASDLEGVRVVISMAGAGSTEESSLGSALFLGGMNDSVVAFQKTQVAFEKSTPSRRLVGIAEGGHLIFSDICEITNDQGQNLIDIATEAGVCGTQFASFLFDCAASTIPAEESGALVRATSTWELEHHLHCDETLIDFDDFGDRSSWVEVLESAEAE